MAGDSDVKLVPKTVQYCGVCGLPPEYCEYGPDFEKCKPWLRQHAPHLYPDLLGVASLSVSSASAPSTEATPAAAEGAQAAPPANPAEAPKPKEEVKRLPGGKVKKPEKKEVVVERAVRGKRKSVSTVKGLEHFGVKLSDAAKKLGKKFASGASVVKDPLGKEQVDVQGDIMLDIVDFLTATWPEIPEEAIFFVEDGKKVPAA